MNLSPPKPPPGPPGSTPRSAAPIFDAAQMPAHWLGGDARIAILCPGAQVVEATSPALALFGAKDVGELESRLLLGEGPSARRLRHLAATLPVGAAMRLERLRFFAGRRPTNLNLRCGRIATPEGVVFLLLSAGAAEQDVIPPAQSASAETAETPPKTRFLWTLDAHGRFGDPHPILVATVGANAPQQGETADAWARRIGAERGGEIARVLAEGTTFSDLIVDLPVAGANRQARLALSAAPAFDRNRKFAGYCGFGVVGRAVEAAPGEETHVHAPDRGAEAVDDPDTADAGGNAAGQDAPGADSAGLIADPARISADAATAGPVRSAVPPDGAEATKLSRQMDGADAGRDTVEAAGAGELAPPAGSIEDAVAGPPEPPRHDISAQSAPDATEERSAEIYVLRQSAPLSAPQTKVVPIRPGALDPPASRDGTQGAPSGSVELSTSERDAFREIARALVGRTPAQQVDRPAEANPVADARDLLDQAFKAPFAPPLARPAAASAALDDEAVRRNAGAMLDRLPIGLLVARDARALYLNRTLLDLLGYKDLEHFQAAAGLAAIFRGRDPQSMQPREGDALRIVRSDGQSLAAEGHAQSIVWDDGPATLFTLRRSPEAATDSLGSERGTRMGNAATQDLQEMLDRATDGAATLDSAARIVSMNSPGERLFGYDQKEIAGESVLMLLQPHSHAEVTARLEALSRTGEADAPSLPLQIVGRDRNGVALALALTLARIGPPEAQGFCALWRDLTRDREAERRLTAARDAAAEASARKTDFLAKVSHEIRTPLHALLGMAEVMMEERFGPIVNERYKDYLKDIHASGRYVMSLADDLLDLSKIESGKLELALAPVDANSLIRECVALMQPQAARERIIMRVSLYDRLPPVMVNDRSLKQIMLNLISNAVKFNEPGGQVIVSTAIDASGQTVIRVRDTGAGMNESEVSLALEPFSQVGNAGRKEGTGLGLPLTKALVEANKAEFTIKSRREHGTLIEIAFPNIQAAQ